METTITSFDVQRIRAQLRKWQERLLDLTKRNPLLGINRSRVSKLKINDPDAYSLFDLFVVNEKTLKMPLVRKEPKRSSLFDESQAQDEEFEYRIEPGDLSFDIKASDLHRRLHRIYDNARTTVEERGVTTLYLSFGVLKWKDAALGDSISPLWMVPCQFESFGPNAALRLSRADEEAQLNPALELYLRERQHVVLPQIIEDPRSESLAEFLEAVGAKVIEQQWRVEPEVWISTYTFESLAIYQDLSALADAAEVNSIVAVLSRATTVPELSEALGEEVLDDLPTSEKVPVPVLETDSSQLKALSLAAAGNNMVIHGPPGTGKSQTICNLIADSLRQNKKVLFVSAKMAALNIVFDRLNRLGLGRFCLEAHSTKAGKAKIIDGLKKTLEAARGANGEYLETQLEDLVRSRSRLNEYVRELHRRHEPLGLTLYQAIGRLEKLWNAPDIAFPLPWDNLLTVTRNDLSSVLDVLQELGAQADVFDVRSSHPWRGLEFGPADVMRKEKIRENLLILLKLGKKIQEELKGLIDLFGPEIATISLEKLQSMASALELLSNTERLPSAWSSKATKDLNSNKEFFDLAKRTAEDFESRKAEYGKILDVTFRNGKKLLEPLDILNSKNAYELCVPAIGVGTILSVKNCVRAHLQIIVHSAHITG